MGFADAHIHLDESKKSSAALAKARKAGVKLFLNCGVDIESNRSVASMVSKELLAAEGIQPIHVKNMTKKQIQDEIKNILKDKLKLSAIGEVGLDKFWYKEEKVFKAQIPVFKEMMKIAEKTKKPLIVHSRDCGKYTMDELKTFKGKCVLHCWTGSKKLTKEAVERGYYFSINPIIFKIPYIEEVVKLVPIEQLLTETDFPYSGEAPAIIPKIVKRIAKIKEISAKKAEQQIYKNFQNLFRCFSIMT